MEIWWAYLYKAVASICEKLQALEQLVEEQLSLNHIASTTSPWNSPFFVIKKKSGKWRMLTDLREVNAIIKPMVALHWGVPSSSMIPQNWKIKVTDLKDCLYPIPHKNLMLSILPLQAINSKNQCLVITGRYCHKECLTVLHYVNYTSSNHLNLLENNSLMLILSTMWMIFF